MNNVTLTGYYAQGDSKDLHEDRYVIERVSKVKDDIWKFEARIQDNKQDMKVSMSFPVKFTGDTPSSKHGGTMFGQFVRNSAPAAQ